MQNAAKTNLNAPTKASPPTSTTPSPDLTAVDQAFESLRQYDSGSSRGTLKPIDEAVLKSLSSGSEKDELERRLLGALRAKGSRVAKEYVCSKLALIGSAQSAVALGEFLSDDALAHPARNALEALTCQEAGVALRGSLPKLAGQAKVGVINSLGKRRDKESVRILSGLLADSDPQVGSAAAAALGDIGGKAAAAALRDVREVAESTRRAVAHARLQCAETLVSEGAKSEAQAIYQALANPDQSKPVQLAAKRGLLLLLQSK